MTTINTDIRAPSRLTFLGETSTPTTNPRWGVYACECGWIGKMVVKNVRRGNSRSCGCLRREMMREAFKTHGHSANRIRTPVYSIWKDMHKRTSNPNSSNWKNYGGRGIRVCERWNAFENFFADMGERPAGKTLDRIDNEKDYSPDICRWATMREQSYNRRNTRRVVWNGATMTIQELVVASGIPEKTLRDRLKSGWSVERAATTPVKALSQKNGVQ